jgi:hypothetical protein
MSTAFSTLKPLAILLVLVSAARTDDVTSAAAAARRQLAPLARFVGGQWVVDGHWASGESLHARAIFEWGIGSTNIHSRTYVKKGASEYQRYEGVFAWHPRKKALVQYSFAFDGNLSESVVDVVDADTFHVGWTPWSSDELGKVRQTLKFTSPDSFTWTVVIKKGDKWEQLIEAVWRRQ